MPRFIDEDLCPAQPAVDWSWNSIAILEEDVTYWLAAPGVAPLPEHEEAASG